MVVTTVKLNNLSCTDFYLCFCKAQGLIFPPWFEREKLNLLWQSPIFSLIAQLIEQCALVMFKI